MSAIDTSQSIAQSWAASLGLVRVDLFSSTFGSRTPGSHSALIDGARASFALSIVEGGSPPERDARSWAWSSNFAHHLSLDPERERLVYRRWDVERQLVLRYPATPADRASLLANLEKAPAPSERDVVLHVLRAFRHLRDALPTVHDAVRVLNALLSAAVGAQRETIDRNAILSARTVQDVVELLSEDARQASGAATLAKGALLSRLGAIPQQLLAGNPALGVPFDSHLFLRHAASELYQEAHLDTEPSRQLPLPGLGRVKRGLLAGTRDVRFTPASLCRLLVQQALAALEPSEARPLRILDPACGSGIFLQEALRELIARGFRGKVLLNGIDVSEDACTISRFMLSHAIAEAREAGISVETQIACRNALNDDEWPASDVVAMNPPFASWETMAEADRRRVKQSLGGLARFRPDMAMAFVWRAVQTIGSGGVVATILPAPLLATTSGEKWRTAISKECDLQLLGRFDTPKFFRDAMVEPAFFVLRRHPPRSGDDGSMLVVTGSGGYEDAAIRRARVVATEGVTPSETHDDEAISNDIYRMHRPVSPISWIPQRRADTALALELQARGLPRVEELFTVRQGVLPGVVKAFVLASDVVAKLPAKERSFFRPALMNASIFDGQLAEHLAIFYPYDRGGPLLEDENDLRKRLPRFYTNHLIAWKDKLESRPRVKRWWELTEHRAWQREFAPKLVSTYFGDQGSFGLDTGGHFVVVQGHAWFWKREASLEGAALDASPDPTMVTSDAFIRSNYGLAYLALLNSRAFTRVVEVVSPRVAGGQYNLSRRFVRNARLPDLANATQVSPSIVGTLARLGRRILAHGLTRVAPEVDLVSAEAYGVDPDILGGLQERGN